MTRLYNDLTTDADVVTAAHGHSQPQKSQQCIAGVLGSNGVADDRGNELMEKRMRSGSVSGMMEGRGSAEFSLTKRKTTAEAATSRLYYMRE
ncbi:hypothetical protein EVAR_45655_1 [Eumeta japonica]|uniref:Uncharacterized protein n=1 Tax=Eumeta variegata TaxID=151549 RepID=A0A4C1Y3C7_EUMVA|nr:hypothetical protein EVAR_45655_1 [Eumeta japonica]